MGSPKKKKTPGRKSKPAPSKQAFSPSLNWILSILAVAAAAVGLIVYQFGLTESDQAPVAAAGEVKSAPAATIEFHKLLGRWLRPDGGYVI